MFNRGGIFVGCVIVGKAGIVCRFGIIEMEAA